MGSGLLTLIILVILSTCYTNGLTLNDLYPYGTQHGDTMRTGSSLPGVSIQPPINNFVRLSPAGLTVTGYRVRHVGFLAIQNDDDEIFLHLLQSSVDFSNTEVYGRTTADPGLINRAMDQINEAFPNTFCSTSPPTQLIIATWIDFQKAGTNPGSNFQLIVVTNGSITFGIALYVDVSITSAQTEISSIINSNFTTADPSFFPFGTTVMNAPSMMLNSNIPETYIFSLNDIPPPDTCSSVCYSCKARLV
uniref:NIDO domain-containing protein n=1 Tax=Amphimedon queenslandica TaxID=400682 RepID=A0A1X7TWA5_AMPQE